MPALNLTPLLANRPARIAILGIGNDQLGDDASGVIAVRMLSERLGERDDILLLDAGPTPENTTGVLRRFKPEAIIMIDAADMGETPGTALLINMADISGISASSHSLPLNVLGKFLAFEFSCPIMMLGIQPADLSLSAPMSGPVSEAVKMIVDDLSSLLR